jgi:hypothetical protein
MTPHVVRETLSDFIHRKYATCEFVDMSEEIDMPTAIRTSDFVRIFKGLAQMRKLAKSDDTLLLRAAAYGNPTVCYLIGLNSNKLDFKDDRGWTALSYASFYRNAAAAEALMAVGCNPAASVEAHPYAIATACKNETLAALFLPFWNGPPPSPRIFVPAIEIEEDSIARRESTGRSATLALIGQVNSRKQK